MTRGNERECVWPCFIANYSCIYVWFQFVTDRDSEDLLPQLLSDIPVGDGGQPLNFLADEIKMVGWDSIFPTKYTSIEWALQHGIAPYQPFCLKITLHVRGPDINGEYDENIDTELISVESMNPEWVIEEWEKHLRFLWGGSSTDFPAEFVVSDGPETGH